jgi:hypothetical protein
MKPKEDERLRKDQEEVRNALELIRERDGRLTPDAVLEAAKDEDSPLHHLFDWDDQAEAQRHRLLVARWIIKSVRFLNPASGDDEPAYVHVQIDNEHYYQSASIAVTNKQEWDSAVNYALTKLAGAQSSVTDLRLVAEAAKVKGGKRRKQYIEAAEADIGKAISNLEQVSSQSQPRAAR